jgi:hypothetical protein
MTCGQRVIYPSGILRGAGGAAEPAPEGTSLA